MLYGRDTQRSQIAELIAAARDHGRSGVLVLRGEAGIGKSALLDWAAEAAGEGPRVLRASGFDAESGIAFAGLSQLLWPVRDRLPALPAPQSAALCGALGVGSAPEDAVRDRFTSGLGVLTLLADLAEDGPVLCLIDDAHWLDKATADTLLFAARRLSAEGVVMLLAARDDGFDGPGLPEVRLDRLGEGDAGRLLAARDLAPAFRARVIQESGGNPLALLEFGASGPDLPNGSMPLPVADRVLARFRGQIGELPASTRLMLLLAAAEGRGHMPSLLGAATALGVGLADLEPAEHARLVEVTGNAITFRHPLVRAASYQGASAARRITAHEALAHSSDEQSCRVRHLAAASMAPDESVAGGLEETAERARIRAGYGTAAALYKQAADLTPGGPSRVRRLRLAAGALLLAGNAEEAEDLAAQAERVNEDPAERARLAEIRATVEFERGEPRTAARMLIEHAPAGDTPAMLRTAALYAWTGGESAEVRRAAGLLDDRDDLVRGMAALVDGDYAGGLPLLAGVVSGPDRPPAMHAGLIIGADGPTLELAAAEVAHLRQHGLVGALPNVLQAQAQVQVATGQHADAETTVAESIALARDTGSVRRADRLGTVLARVAAIEGDQARLTELAARAPQPGGGFADCAQSLLDLALGRYDSALRRLEQIAQGTRLHTAGVMQSAADHVEAAVRAGEPERGRDALERFRDWAQAGEQPWALAVALRLEALLSDDEKPYVQAVQLHEQATRPFEQARTNLVYGEWLRRQRRRSDARAPLRSALEVFERLRAVPWAERARQELRATGETGSAAEPTAPVLVDRLTPQELQVVRLAAEGTSSREIAAQLFLSPRTVEYHLYKAYPKLGISSRKELVRLGLETIGP